jgi:Ca-activated chloride channel family protein
VELVAVESLPLVAVLVFDTSGSVEGMKLVALRAAGEAFVAGMRPQDEIGLVTFSHEVRLVIRPTTDRGGLQRALRDLAARGPTALWDALYAGLLLVPERSRALVLLFSDGEDNLSLLEEADLRTEAERSNAVVHAVGVRSPAVPAPLGPRGRPRDETEPDHVRALRQTAEATGGRFWIAESPARLTEAFSRIVAAMNTRYVLRYEPRGGVTEGWHRIDLRLRGVNGEVRARRGYFRAGRPSPIQ